MPEDAPAAFAVLIKPIAGERPVLERLKAFGAAAVNSLECILSAVGTAGGFAGTFFIPGPLPTAIAGISGVALLLFACASAKDARGIAERSLMLQRFIARSGRNFAAREDAERAFDILYAQWEDLRKKGECAREWFEEQKKLRLRGGEPSVNPEDLRKAAERSPLREELLAVADAAEKAGENKARILRTALPVAMGIAESVPTEEKRTFLRRTAEELEDAATRENRLRAEMKAVERALGWTKKGE